MIKIIQYRENCIGCNACVQHAPNNWEISEDGKATLKNSKNVKDMIYILEITQAELTENKLAAQDCPMNIIKVVEN